MPDEPIHADVIDAVAERESVPPEDLPEPLYATVDPEALDALFRDGRGRVTFQYLDYEVTVDHTGAVDVTPLERS